MINAFRIFKAGWNDSVKGRVLFDDAAATSVMAAYEQHGVDVMIDLEHLSLDTESKAYNPDAFGWCKLAIQNGELWAIDVRWTPQGLERLTNKKSRYISPAFFVDDEQRVREILNIAICAMPATHEAMPLVAASKKQGRPIGLVAFNVRINKMDPKAVCEALGLPEDASTEQVIEALNALKSAAAPKEEAPPAAPAEDPEAEKRARVADETIKALSKELAEVKAAVHKRDVDDFISKHTNKISPALEAWARMQTLDNLRAFVAGAPDVVAAPVEQPKHEPKAIELTAAEREICKLTNQDPEKVLAYKRSKVA